MKTQMNNDTEIDCNQTRRCTIICATHRTYTYMLYASVQSSARISGWLLVTIENSKTAAENLLASHHENKIQRHSPHRMPTQYQSYKMSDDSTTLLALCGHLLHRPDGSDHVIKSDSDWQSQTICIFHGIHFP